MSTEDEDEEKLVNQMDSCMERYYNQLNKPYKNNETGLGKLKEFCQVNEFRDDTVREEMEVTDYDDCYLVDFDEDFPFADNHKPDNRNEQIFEILKRCYEDPEAYTGDITFAAFKVSPRDFEIEEKDKDEILNLFKTQCKKVWNSGFENDKSGSLLNLLFISTKLGRPYLPLLCDTYARDRLNAYQDDIKLKLIDWGNQNRHMVKLRDSFKDKNAYDMVISAIRLWYKRILPLMMLRSQIKILDKFEDICEAINEGIEMVYNLSQVKKGQEALGPTCPFQYEFCIAYNFVTMDSDHHTVIPGTQQSQSQSGDIDQDEEDNDDDDELKTNTFFDCMGNIKKRLKDKNIEYYVELRKPVNNTRLADSFREFSEKIASKQLDDNYKKLNQYPRNRRFVSILDRRKPEKKGINNNMNKEIENDEELLLFEPPQSIFPSNHKVLDLWFYNSSKTVIIPQTSDFKDEDLDEKRLKTQSVNTEVPCKGAFMVLSFHVLSADEVRCYFYLNGQMIRFFPDDLINYLPQFFVLNKENKAYAKSQELKKLINNMKSKLIDKRFEAWYKEYRTPEK